MKCIGKRSEILSGGCQDGAGNLSQECNLNKRTSAVMDGIGFSGLVIHQALEWKICMHSAGSAMQLHWRIQC